MKKTILLGAGLLLSALLTIAQNTPQSGSSTSQPPTTRRSDQTNANSSTLQGCLRGSSGNYTLIDMAGMSYQLTGDESQMKENVNKQVEVTGATGSNASAGSTGATGAGTGSANTGAANSGQTGSTPTDAGTTANRMLTVASIRAIADSCSAEQGK